jgi:hypothetical protein
MKWLLRRHRHPARLQDRLRLTVTVMALSMAIIRPMAFIMPIMFRRPRRRLFPHGWVKEADRGYSGNAPYPHSPRIFLRANNVWAGVNG